MKFILFVNRLITVLQMSWCWSLDLALPFYMLYSLVFWQWCNLYILYFQPAQVNLNHMLCPAVKDPFSGPLYRLFAIVHQAILCPLLSKVVPALVSRFLPNKPHFSWTNSLPKTTLQLISKIKICSFNECNNFLVQISLP